MGKSRKSVKLGIMLLLALFTVNTAVMYIFFDINVFNAGSQSNSSADSSYGYNPGWRMGGSSANGTAGTDVIQSDGLSGGQAVGESGDKSEIDQAATQPGNKFDGQSLYPSGQAGNMPVQPTAGGSTNAGSGAGTWPDSNGSMAETGYYLTPQQVLELENLDIYDKFKAVAILSKVDGKEIDKIIEMAQDGLTYAELGKVEKTLARYLTAAEIGNLKDILKKYCSTF